jgi:hypothetical protein
VLAASTFALLVFSLASPERGTRGDDASATEAGDRAKAPSEEIIFLYTVNNLGYTDVCG